MDLKTAAKTYNRDYPEAAAEIDAGTEEIRVTLDSHGTGWTVNVTATAGIRATDGGFIAAAEPVATGWIRRPKWAAKDSSKLTRWWGRKSFPATTVAH